ADGGTFLGQVYLLQNQAIHTQYQLRHSSIPLRNYLNQLIILASGLRGAGKSRSTRTSITEILSRPPLSFAVCTRCCAHSLRLELSVCSVRPISSSLTISQRPSEQSR